jgi:hypothetical protein
MISDFIIPIIFIGIGVWMKSIYQKDSSGFERFWWVFILIGVIKIILELIRLSML